MLMKNKRGWIKIVEAFVAVLLIAGVVLIIIDKEYLKKEDISSEVYDTELKILKEIQLNNTLRENILTAGPLPVNWTNFPQSVRNKIINDIPDYLNCNAKICEIEDACTIDENSEKDIYVQSVIITSTLDTLNYRQLKLFCWVKE
jgi:hypothetical protein